MQSRPIDHVLGVLIVALVICVRTLVPEALTGDLLLTTLLVFACVVDLPLLLTVTGVAVLWTSVYPGMSLALLLMIVLPLVVFALRQRTATRWRSWVLSAAVSVVGVLLFNAALHPRVFMNVPGTVAMGTAYALLYSIVLFGILREIYVRQER